VYNIIYNTNYLFSPRELGVSFQQYTTYNVNAPKTNENMQPVNGYPLSVSRLINEKEKSTHKKEKIDGLQRCNYE